MQPPHVSKDDQLAQGCSPFKFWAAILVDSRRKPADALAVEQSLVALPNSMANKFRSERLPRLSSARAGQCCTTAPPPHPRLPSACCSADCEFARRPGTHRERKGGACPWACTAASSVLETPPYNCPCGVASTSRTARYARTRQPLIGFAWLCLAVMGRWRPVQIGFGIMKSL